MLCDKGLLFSILEYYLFPPTLHSLGFPCPSLWHRQGAAPLQAHQQTDGQQMGRSVRIYQGHPEHGAGRLHQRCPG